MYFDTCLQPAIVTVIHPNGYHRVFDAHLSASRNLLPALAYAERESRRAPGLFRLEREGNLHSRWRDGKVALS